MFQILSRIIANHSPLNIISIYLIYVELALVMIITKDFVSVNSYFMFYEIRCVFPWRRPDVFILRHLYK